MWNATRGSPNDIPWSMFLGEKLITGVVFLGAIASTVRSTPCSGPDAVCSIASVVMDVGSPSLEGIGNAEFSDIDGVLHTLLGISATSIFVLAVLLVALHL